MREIELTRGYKAIVDEEDFERVSQHKWLYIEQGYARTKINRKTMSLHRFIMNARPGQVVDHRNHDKLDNRRTNLRICTQRQNSMNKRTPAGRRFKGIDLHHCGRYRARVRRDGKLLFVGWADTPEEAAALYNLGAIKHFGEFAYLNSIPAPPL